MIVPRKFDLSAITNNIKNTIAKTKQTKEEIPNTPLDDLRKSSPTNKGANVKSMKPTTDP